MVGEPTITITLGLALAGGLWSLLRYFIAELAQERRWREDADEAERSAREKVSLDDQNRNSILYRELSAYKLEAVEKFATAGAIEKSEERLALAIDKMTARLEMVIGRIETLSVEMARVGKTRSSAS